MKEWSLLLHSTEDPFCTLRRIYGKKPRQIFAVVDLAPKERGPRARSGLVATPKPMLDWLNHPTHP